MPSARVLVDPDKRDALRGEREATSRLRRVMYWLSALKAEGREPGQVIDAAQLANGSAGTQRGKLLRESLLRNLDILGNLGCINAAGIEKRRTT